MAWVLDSFEETEEAEVWLHYVGLMNQAEAEAKLRSHEWAYLVRREKSVGELYSPSLSDLIVSYAVRRGTVAGASTERLLVEECGCGVTRQNREEEPIGGNQRELAPLMEAESIIVKHASCRRSIEGWRDASSGEVFATAGAWLRSKLNDERFRGVQGLDDRRRYEIRTFFDDLATQLDEISPAGRQKALICRQEALIDPSLFEELERAWREALFVARVSGRPISTFPEPTKSKPKVLTPLPPIHLEATPRNLLVQIARAFSAIEQRRTQQGEEDYNLSRLDLLQEYPNFDNDTPRLL